MMPDVFDTAGVDLDQFLGTRNDTTGVVVEDKDLITHIKGILGPFVLRRLKSDVMRQLVPKIQQVLPHPLLLSGSDHPGCFVNPLWEDCKFFFSLFSVTLSLTS
jgi:hypothetical protein